jgi:hypothetical protein
VNLAARQLGGKEIRNPDQNTDEYECGDQRIFVQNGY